LSRKFIQLEEPSQYNPPDVERLAELGITSHFGGIEGYQGEPGFHNDLPTTLLKD